MLLFWRRLVFLLSALILAGCSTVQEEPAPSPLPPAPAPLHLAAPAQPPQPRPATTNLLPVVAKTNAVVATNNPISTNAIAPTNAAALTAPAIHTQPFVRAEPLHEWVEMQRWSATNGCSQLRQTGGGALPRFSLHSPHGDIDFTVKSQIAHWNGLAFMLSFPPQLSHGRPYVHTLDLQHSILPLIKNNDCPSSGTRILVLDPGHGGDQPGSQTVVGNRSEKELTLDWALRIQSSLASRDTNHTWKVFLTRSSDVDVPLSNRVAVADSHHADLFISLHFNSFANPEQIGLETYCLTPAGMPSNLVRGSEDELAQPNNSFDAANLCWAMQLHRELIRTTRAPDRGVRRARFMAVLRNQKRPAILIEGGYLSNRKEAKLITSENYRQKLADAVVKALLKE